MESRNYVRLYEELGVRVTGSSAGEVLGLCSAHRDIEKPSFSFNRESGLYKCFVPNCPAFTGGSYAKFYKIIKGIDLVEEVPFEEIMEHHETLLKNSRVMTWLRDSRGLNEDTIKKFLLGMEADRLWIPIQIKGKYLNVRRHALNKKTTVKSLSYRAGFGSVQLWPDVPDNSAQVVLCEGELDCLLASQLGFDAHTVTGGAGQWKDEFTNSLRTAQAVALLYDIDTAGRAGASLVARKVHTVCPVVKDVVLPLTTPRNGDLTDYVVGTGAGRKELEELIANTEPYTGAKNDSSEGSLTPDVAVPVSISDVSLPGNVGRRVSFRSTIAGVDSTPYVIPKKIEFKCAVAGTKKSCILCSIHQSGGNLVVDVPASSQDILRSIDITEEQQKLFHGKAAGVFTTCPAWKFEIPESHSVYDVRVASEITYENAIENEYTMRQGFVVGHNIQANHVYEMQATPFSSPKNQQLTLLIDKATPARDNLTDFKLTEEQKEALRVFQNEIQTVEQKMFEIANDLSLNVTRIYSREDLVIACDLVYHSTLNLKFQGRVLPKGRVDLLVIGDTRCGKSETFMGLLNHYRCGEIITGENTSKAGILGGAQQIGSRWMTTWGKLPMNDRRLLIVDEISGMAVEDIGALSGVRSSGVAEINKIQSEKMWARTRGIWAGNPRSTKNIAAYDTGIQAAKELIGRPEDLARFDLCVCLMSGEVSLAEINARERPVVEHKYTSELCNLLVTWAWSRRAEQIEWDPDAEALCLKLATEMSTRYSSVIPLVEGAEQRIKLARLAVACAVRLFSTLDGDTVLIKPEHVSFVHSFLEKQYRGPGLNYLAFSEVKIADQNLKDEEAVRKVLMDFGKPLIDGFLDHSYVKMSDLEDILGLDKKEVRPIITQLLGQRAIRHSRSAYAKTPAFILLLRKMQLENHPVPKPPEVEF